jgi:parvulin-like peptidyl-prolyl isomerase
MMKSSCLLLLVCLGAASAQTPAPPVESATPAAVAEPKAAPAIPELPDPTVVAEFQDGTKFTMGELKKLFPVLPAQLQNAIKQDPVEFFHEYAMMLKCEQIALERKLDQQSPVKEALEFDRLIYLYQAALQDVFATTTVDSNEIINYYGQHKDGFKRAQVKAIYIPFADAPAPEDKSLTEAQAKAKADKLVAEIKKGADFVKLVKANSEDETSKAKDGDFGTFATTDPLPDAIRTAVFALDMGGVTEPVRQPHGFYIFKAQLVTIRPLSDVRNEIFDVLKQQHAKEWVDATNAQIKVSFPNPAFPPKGAPTAPAK